MREDAKMGFVADARERLIRAGWRQIVRDIRAGHARELERAGLFDRMRIEARIREDEMVEVTPHSFRLRKRILQANRRK